MLIRSDNQNADVILFPIDTFMLIMLLLTEFISETPLPNKRKQIDFVHSPLEVQVSVNGVGLWFLFEGWHRCNFQANGLMKRSQLIQDFSYFWEWA